MPYKPNNSNQNQNQKAGGRERKLDANGEPIKHSGCKLVTDGESNFISAWNYRYGQGMVTVFGFRYKDTKQVTAKESGKVWENWMAEIKYKDSGVQLLRPAMFEVATGRLLIKDLGWVCNHKARRGGYCGTMFKSKKRPANQ